MKKSYTKIKYLFVLPCLVLCLSNGYSQTVCYPLDSGEATTMPGTVNVNPASCDIATGEPDEVITIPTLECADAAAVTFDTPILPANPSVLYHYWGNCAPNSPVMPTDFNANRQGYIQQMFCDVDGFGLPAWPGGLSGENGTINFIPQETEDVGCNNFAAVGTCVCGVGANADPEQEGVELIQLDFWLAVNSLQPQVGFRFFPEVIGGGGGGRADAASFFVGPDLFNMCEVAYFKDGNTHINLPNQPTGTYNIDSDMHESGCGLVWMRVRLYIHDIDSRFRVVSEINAGSGYVNLNQLLVVPAMSVNDNTAPSVAIAATPTAGYLVNGPNGEQFIYNEDGSFNQYACDPVASATDAGVCACDPDEVVAATAPPVTVTESTCIAPATIPSGGVVAIPTGTCPENSTLEYSIDGVNFSDVLPMYDQSNPITVTTRCVCVNDPTVVSIPTEVTTIPAVCCNPDCGTFPANPVGN